MKNILFLLFITTLLFSCCDCGPQPKKQYDFEIITTNGDTINTSFVGFGDNMFSLKSGDLTTQSFSKTLISGVRSYTVSIKNLGNFTPKNREDYELKQITTE